MEPQPQPTDKPPQSCVKQTIKSSFHFFILLLILSIFYIPFLPQHHLTTIIKIFSANESTGNPTSGSPDCSDVLEWMKHGSWKLKPATWEQRREQEKFMFVNRIDIRTHTRVDNRCGNVSVADAYHFRALCNPVGPRACCYNNVCENRPMKECTCKDCYDLRDLKHAELGTWVPDDKSCPLTQFTNKEACEIMDGANVLFIGDSFMRHFHTAMMLSLSGNLNGGALQRGSPEAIIKKCSGIFMYTEVECRYYLRHSGTVCGGRTNVTMAYVYFAKDYGRALQHIRFLKDKPRSIVVTGVGFHDWLDVEKTKTYIVGVDKEMRDHVWPRFIWHAVHSQGVLKSPYFISQQNQNVAIFNRKIKNFLMGYNFEVFDTFNMTKGLFSFDGTHYGIGVNRMKVLMLLHYIKQQKKLGKWQ